MTSTIDASRHAQRSAVQTVTVHICKACERHLSIAEFIERHCEACKKDVEVVATRGRS